MGLDMYLGRYHKANLEKRTFTEEETEKLRDWGSGYDLFDKCPKPFENIATEIKVVNLYYDMKKISNDFANGNTLRICGYGEGNISFRDDNKGTELDLDENMIYKDYLLEKKESAYIVEGEYEVAYWRKANQIREWFLNHIEEFNYDDNGEFYTVTKELLEELIDDCKYVLNHHDQAEIVLPTSSGFFFGGTDYDEYYYDQLESTIKQCQEVINETDWDNEVVIYTESW